MTTAQPVRQPVRQQRVVRRGWSTPIIGPGLVVGGLGAIGLIVSLFLPWREGGVHVADVPVSFLWDSTTRDSDPSLLIFLIPAAVLLVAGALLPLGAGLRIFGGIATLAIVLFYAWQLDNTLSGFPGADLGDVLGVGAYVAGVSGILALASGFVPSSSRRQDEEIVETGA